LYFTAVHIPSPKLLELVAIELQEKNWEKKKIGLKPYKIFALKMTLKRLFSYTV